MGDYDKLSLFLCSLFFSVVTIDILQTVNEFMYSIIFVFDTFETEYFRKTKNQTSKTFLWIDEHLSCFSLVFVCERSPVVYNLKKPSLILYFQRSERKARQARIKG